MKTIQLCCDDFRSTTASGIVVGATVSMFSRLVLIYAPYNDFTAHLAHTSYTPPVRRSTVGARAFPVTGPALWNSLPADITSIDSLPVFRHRLKNYFFSHSYPGTVQ